MKLFKRGSGGGMQITVDAPLRAGDTDIEPGDYDVAVDTDGGTIALSQDGTEVLRAEAFARPSKAAVDEPNVRLRQVKDEPRRLLVARTPPADEWVLSLDERG